MLRGTGVFGGRVCRRTATGVCLVRSHVSSFDDSVLLLTGQRRNADDGLQPGVWREPLWQLVRDHVRRRNPTGLRRIPTGVRRSATRIWWSTSGVRWSAIRVRIIRNGSDESPSLGIWRLPRTRLRIRAGIADAIELRSDAISVHAGPDHSGHRSGLVNRPGLCINDFTAMGSPPLDHLPLRIWHDSGI